MQTGLENMRDKIMQDTTHWKQIDMIENEYGDCTTIFYCEHQDLSCYMRFEKDMDQEYYLTKIEFYDGRRWLE